MSRIHKPSGYITAANDDHVYAETRQCGHCQYTWVYKPGSGNKRGVCMKCMKLVCARKVCQDRYRCGSFDH